MSRPTMTAATDTGYITTIGIEVHVQLKTHSKMFCRCATSFAAPPNSNTCPVCLGLPGALPVMNKEAVRMTILTGLMFGCTIAERCKWDRKNYFYADMPKNYQISQYDLPLCLDGGVPLHDLAYPKDAQKSIATPDKVVRLTRIHLEEDVAKSSHFGSTSGIDFNRAGCPLMEIVSEPDINSAEEAFAYLTSLRQHLLYAGVSDANMEMGQMRADVNISIRPIGQKDYNPKVEVKNVNSVSAVRRAILFETDRQIMAIQNGEALSQMTVRWDEASGGTIPMRSKEMAHDYRYFPDPDLLPVETPELLAQVKGRLPELPTAKRARFIDSYGVTPYDAAVLADDLELADWFERAAGPAPKRGKAIANLMMNELLSALSSNGQTLADCPIAPGQLGGLVELVDTGKITSKQAKEVFTEMFAHGKDAAAIVEEKGYKVADSSEIEKFVDEAIAANPKPAQEYAEGNDKSLNFLKGQVMRLSKGQADPSLIGELIEKKLRG